MIRTSSTLLLPRKEVVFIIIGNVLPALNLKELRKASSKTQEQVANEVGCTVKTYRSWEKGYALPDTYYLKALSSIFGVSTDYLLGLSEVKSKDMNVRALHDDLGLSEEAAANLIDYCKDSNILDGLIPLLEHRNEFQDILTLVSRCKNYTPMTNLEAEYIKQGITTKNGNMTLDQMRALTADRFKYRNSALTDAKYKLETIMRNLMDEKMSESAMLFELFCFEKNENNARGKEDGNG